MYAMYKLFRCGWVITNVYDTLIICRSKHMTARSKFNLFAILIQLWVLHKFNYSSFFVLMYWSPPRIFAVVIAVWWRRYRWCSTLFIFMCCCHQGKTIKEFTLPYLKRKRVDIINYFVADFLFSLKYICILSRVFC